MSTEMLTVGSIWFNNTRYDPEIEEVWSNIKELLEMDWIEEVGWKQGASYIDWHEQVSVPEYTNRYVSFVSLDWSYHSDISEIKQELKQYLPYIDELSISFNWLGDSDESVSLDDLTEVENEQGIIVGGS